MDPDPYNFPGSEAVMNPNPEPHNNYSYPGLQDIFNQKEHIFYQIGCGLRFIKKKLDFSVFQFLSIKEQDPDLFHLGQIKQTLQGQVTPYKIINPSAK